MYYNIYTYYLYQNNCFCQPIEHNYIYIPIIVINLIFIYLLSVRREDSQNSPVFVCEINKC